MGCLRRSLGWWLLGLKHHDLMIRNGDWIRHRAWRHCPVRVVGQNWAIRAVAIQLGERGGVIVVPMDPKSQVAHPIAAPPNAEDMHRGAL